MRIVHISDLHFWRITLSPVRLWGKRILGMGNLVLNRARKYHMERMPQLVGRIRELRPDHILISGDLTTTSLEEEFEAARSALVPLQACCSSITIIPGNHDRYTRAAARGRLFERYLGDFMPLHTYPWLREIGERTAILCLDAARPNPISARGFIQAEQIESARRLLEEAGTSIDRLVVACHYPVAVPEGAKQRSHHDLRGKADLRSFLSRLGPHLYCHGHIHAEWAFVPADLPGTICLNPGAALKRREQPEADASLLEILLDGSGVEIFCHVHRRGSWDPKRLTHLPRFFANDSL